VLCNFIVGSGNSIPLPARRIRLPGGQAAAGFTLIELLTVLLIVAIITVVAVPTYNNYVTKSMIRSAQADLVALSLGMENVYLQTLAYPAATSSTAGTVSAIGSVANPAEKDSFKYTIGDVASSPPAYTLTATGTGTRVSGYVITLGSDNTRTLTKPDGSTGSWL